MTVTQYWVEQKIGGGNWQEMEHSRTYDKVSADCRLLSSDASYKSRTSGFPETPISYRLCCIEVTVVGVAQ